MTTNEGRLRSLLQLPVSENEERTRRAQLAYLIAWIIAIVPLLYGGYALASSQGGIPVLEVAPVLIVSAVSFLLIFLIRRGWVEVSSILLLVLVWSGFAFLAYNLGGISDAGYAGFIIVIMMAGLLFGGRAAVAVTVLSLLAGWVLIDAEVRGTLPVDTDTPTDIFINYLVLFLLATGLVSASSRGFRSLLARVQEGARDLRARNWELQQMRDSLEVRVAERTADLDRRTRYLEAAAQVAYAAGEILDAGQLMRESVDLIQRAFDLYYVGLFEVDGAREWALLRAGTGEAGAQMLAREHRIRIGSGMIGWSIAHRESRFAQQAAEDEVRLATPELPETRAEAALPLRARGRVLGALTVQSAEPDFFDEATVTVLQTMADLLAVALSNAALFEERQQSMVAVRRAYAEIVSDAWSDLLASRGQWGYRYVEGIVRPSVGEPSEAIREAIRRASSVEVDGEGVSSIVLPLRIGGQAMGAISYRRRADEGGWSEADVALLSTVTDQVAQALDGARLLQETQGRAAREQQINDIVARVANAVDAETMIRSVVDDLERLPDIVEASVHLGEDDASQSDVVVEASAASSGVSVPIRLRNQVLGVLNLRFDGDSAPPDTVQLAEQVADRLAVSLETARLLEMTRRTAQRERMIASLTRRMRESLEVNEVMARSAREIREALDLRRVSVRLAPGNGHSALEGANGAEGAAPAFPPKTPVDPEAQP